MSEAFAEIKQRCEIAGLEYVEHIFDPEYRISYIEVHFPKGRRTQILEVLEDGPDHYFRKEPFEAYRLIEGFSASWSPERQLIECSLVHNDLQASLRSNSETKRLLQELGQEVGESKTLDPEDRIEIDSRVDLRISIGPCSNIHGILQYGYFLEDLEDFEDEPELEVYRPLTLRIEGVSATTHDAAAEVLQRVSDATLFQIDLSLDLSLAIEREGHSRDTRRFYRQPQLLVSLAPLRFEYDREPMSLYWYAKMASTMPLLQFLAYYQVLEFYFPIYSELEAQESLRNLLKDPTFDPVRDADIAKLLQVVKISSRGRAFGNEEAQLEATIRHCVNADELRTFLISKDENRYKFYTSDNAKKLVKERVPVREKADDHRGAVAKRIYAIRNRIVHTKGRYEEQEPLFPFDPETKYMRHDIELVEFLARRVLIASSRPLQV